MTRPSFPLVEGPAPIRLLLGIKKSTNNPKLRTPKKSPGAERVRRGPHRQVRHEVRRPRRRSREGRRAVAREPGLDATSFIGPGIDKQ